MLLTALKLPPTTKQFLSGLLFLLCCNLANAQIRNAYQIGSIGMSGSKSPVYSGPVIIAGTDCFAISNGMNTFELPQVGFFSTACKFQMPQISNWRVISYPNPVMNKVTIKSVDQIQLANEIEIQMDLLDISGRLIQTYHPDLKILNAGYTIDMSAMANGTYLIKLITASNKFQVLTIIKSK
jgi:hypothetical protein